MHRTVDTLEDFQQHWDGVHNFLMDGPCKPFDYKMPPLERLVSELRDDPQAKIFQSPTGIGKHGRVDISDAFRAQPLSEAMQSQFLLRHMDILKFDRPGRLLDGFCVGVLRPLLEMLLAGGFTWNRSNCYVFASGPGCCSALHMDRSHVIAWQVYGRKQFSGFKEPQRFATYETRRNHVLAFDPDGYDLPEQLTDDDWLTYDMQPGDVLWNALHTMHVVAGGDEPSLSINISFGGLRHNGRLCPHEADMYDFMEEQARGASQVLAM